MYIGAMFIEMEEVLKTWLIGKERTLWRWGFF
jgi:hypothetical protein